MKTAKETEKEFMKELLDMLRKWDASIELEDNSANFSNYKKMAIIINAKYKDGECIAEYVSIQLPDHVNGYN